MVEGAAQDPLKAWLLESHFRVMMLEEWGLRADDGVVTDYSGESLRGLETFVLGYFSTPDAVYFDGADITDPDTEAISVEGLAAYLGDTLLGLVGGRWEWVADAPLVRPPAVLGLDPVSPVRLR